MGWCYESGYYESMKDYVNRGIIKSLENNQVKVLDKSLKSSRLWLLAENSKKMKFILLYLLGKHQGWYGYKSIDEDCGPFYFDCPKRMIKNQPEVRSEFSREWREKVLNK